MRGADLIDALGRFASRAAPPPPRAVDWSLFALLAIALASGVFSLGVGDPSGAIVFWLHGAAGLALAAFLGLKLLRVRRRVVDPRLRDRATVVSVAAVVVALGALGTGVFWVLGGNFDLLYWNAMNVHVLFGLLLGPLVLVHLAARFRPPRAADFAERRAALRVSALLVGGALARRTQTTANDLLGAAGAARRFTGSKPVDGEGFPVTSWVADDPDPIDREAWRLSVRGLVAEPLELAARDLDPATGRRALLDCTSGWYTVQDWRGVRVGDLLERAGIEGDAAWVRVRSVTGYRWSFPLAEAREMLLATHVGGDPLSHGHGAPLRLVAPGRRGFQWVKWVDAVEVRSAPDLGQYVAVLVSGFDGGGGSDASGSTREGGDGTRPNDGNGQGDAPDPGGKTGR
jgi:DMSO/TMAO reductase YedYZ molybdopterin-dependent catalytic subunit